MNGTDSSLLTSLIVNVPSTERSDPVLHVQSGQLWMDWKHSNTQFGSAEYVNASWGSPVLYDWSDPSWVGVESMRLFIRGRLVAVPHLVDLEP